MKMIQAILRPEKIKQVEDALKDGGFTSLTELSVRGRGKQQGIVIGGMHYDKLPKECLLLTCKDKDLETVLAIILKAARTGSMGDGKIFVLPVEEVVTIRTGERGESAL